MTPETLRLTTLRLVLAGGVYVCQVRSGSKQFATLGQILGGAQPCVKVKSTSGVHTQRKLKSCILGNV